MIGMILTVAGFIVFLFVAALALSVLPNLREEEAQLRKELNRIYGDQLSPLPDRTRLQSRETTTDSASSTNGAGEAKQGAANEKEPSAQEPNNEEPIPERPDPREDYIPKSPEEKALYDSFQDDLRNEYVAFELRSQGPDYVTYRGQQTRTGRIVFIKVTSIPALDEPENVPTFNREYLEKFRNMELQRDAEHPAFPFLVDFVFKANRIYTITEFVEGEHLEELLLERQEPIPLSQKFNWACKLLDALVSLHENGVVHGNIQLSSVMLETPRKGRREDNIRLVNLDWALNLRETSRMAVPADYFRDAGNLPFDASKTVELKSGEEAFIVDNDTDLLQFGWMFYQLLTGRATREDSPEQRRNFLTAYGVPEYVADVILKATADKQIDRYASAADMVSALKAAPVKDPLYEQYVQGERRRQTFLKRGFTLGAACIALGLPILAAERHRTVRALEMDRSAQRAVNERKAGDYSAALHDALQGVSNRFLDPAPTPEAQYILAETLGVYRVFTPYRPQNSISDLLRGKPIKAALSPDGRRLAALIADTSGENGPRMYIQCFDAENGAELTQALPAVDSALAGFVFRDNKELLYAGADGLSIVTLPEKANALTQVDARIISRTLVTSVALSEDGFTVAAVEKTGDSAFLYRLDTQKSARLSFRGKQQSVPPNETFTDPGDNLFALNADGRWLAASFSDGSLDLFDVQDFERLNEEDFRHTVQMNSKFTRFEGGFYGGIFVYTASTKSLSQPVASEYAAFDIEHLRPAGPVQKQSFPVHAQADSGGAYVSVGNLLLRYEPDKHIWSEIGYADSTITRLRIGGGRVLTVTANHTVTVYDAADLHGETVAADLHGETVSEGVAFQIASLAGDRILLASQDRPTLSLLLRQNRTPLFRYPDFEHTEARVYSDKKSAILFRAHGFLIIDENGAREPRFFEDWKQIISQGYQRGPVREDDPDTECVFFVYPDRTEYYDAREGGLLSTRTETSFRNVPDQFPTADFLVEYTLNGYTIVRDRRTNREIKTFYEGNCFNAFQQGENLILFMLTLDRTYYSLLLNKQCEVLATLPNLCDVLPDGTLIFDDGKGQLVSEVLYSLDDLRNLASDRGSYEK